MSKDNTVNIYDSVDTELMIDPKNLQGELMDQSLLMRKWTRAKAMANKTAKILRTRQAIHKGNLHKQFAKQGLRVGDIEAAINTDPQFTRITEELIEAEFEFEMLEGVVRAFYQKHESLKDLSANARKGVED
jgi:hypothetical protein